MSKGVVTLVGDSGGEWEGLFVDGKLQEEAHSLSAFRILTVLSSHFDFTFNEAEVDAAWMEGLGSFPYDLADVKLSKS